MSTDYALTKLMYSLPGRTDELIEAVLKVQPEAIVIVQSGMPVAMPWEPKTKTLVQVRRLSTILIKLIRSRHITVAVISVRDWQMSCLAQSTHQPKSPSPSPNVSRSTHLSSVSENRPTRIKPYIKR